MKIEDLIKNNEDYKRFSNINDAINKKREEEFKNKVNYQKQEKIDELDHLTNLVNNAYKSKVDFQKIKDQYELKQQKIKSDMINSKDDDSFIKSLFELKEVEKEYQLSKKTGQMIYDINSDKLNIQRKAKAMKNMYEYEAKNELINNEFYNKLIENQDYSYVDNPYIESFGLSDNLAKFTNTLNNGSYSLGKAFVYGLDRSFTSAKLGLFNILNKVSLLEDKTLAKTVKEFQNLALHHNYIPLITEDDDFISVISSPEKIISLLSESGGEILRNMGELALGGALLKGAMSLAGNTVKGMSLGKYLNNMETYANTLRKAGLSTEARYFESALGNSLSGIRQMTYTAMNNKNFRNLIGMSLLEGALRSAEFASSRSTDGTLDVKLSDFLYGTLYGALGGTGTIAMLQKNPLSQQVFKNGLRDPLRSTAFGLGSVGFAGAIEGLTEAGQTTIENLTKYSNREYVTAKEKSDIYHEIIQSGQLGSIAGGSVKSAFGLPSSFISSLKNVSNKIRRSGINNSNEIQTLTDKNFEDYAILNKDEFATNLNSTAKELNLGLREENNLINRLNNMHTELLQQKQNMIKAFKIYDFNSYKQLFDKIDNTNISDIRHNSFTKEEITALNQLYDDISNGKVTKFEQMQNIEARLALLNEISQDKDLLKAFIDNKEINPKNFQTLSSEDIETKFDTVKEALSKKKLDEAIQRQNQINEVNNISKSEESFSQDGSSSKQYIDNDSFVETSILNKQFQNKSLLGLINFVNRNLNDPSFKDKIKEVLDEIDRRKQEFKELKESGKELQDRINNELQGIHRKQLSLGKLSEYLVKQKQKIQEGKTLDQSVADIFLKKINSEYKNPNDITDEDLDKFFEENQIYKIMKEHYEKSGKLDVYNNVIKERKNVIKKLLNNNKFLYTEQEVKDNKQNLSKIEFNNSYFDLKKFNELVDIFSYAFEFLDNINNNNRPNALFKTNIQTNKKIDDNIIKFLENNRNQDIPSLNFIQNFNTNNFTDILNKDINEALPLIDSYISTLSNNFDIVFNNMEYHMNQAKQLMLDADPNKQKQGKRLAIDIQRTLYNIENNLKEHITVLPAKDETLEQYLSRIYGLIKHAFRKAKELFNSIVFNNIFNKNKGTTEQKQQLFNSLGKLKELLLTTNISLQNVINKLNEDYKKQFGEDIAVDLNNDISIPLNEFAIFKEVSQQTLNSFNLDGEKLYKIFYDKISQLNEEKIKNNYNFNAFNNTLKYMSKEALNGILDQDIDFQQNLSLLKKPEVINKMFMQNYHFMTYSLMSYIETLRELATNDNSHTKQNIKYNDNVIVKKVVVNANALPDIFKGKMSKFAKYYNYDMPIHELTTNGLELANIFFGAIQEYNGNSLVQLHFDGRDLDKISNYDYIKYNQTYNKYSNNKYLLLNPKLFDKRESIFFQNLSSLLQTFYTYDNQSRSNRLPTNEPVFNVNKNINAQNNIALTVNTQGLDELSKYIDKNNFINQISEVDVVDNKSTKESDITLDNLLSTSNVFKYPNKDGGFSYFRIDKDIIMKFLSTELDNVSVIDDVNVSNIGKLRSKINDINKAIGLYAIYKNKIKVDNNPFFDENGNVKKFYLEYEFTNVGRIQLKEQLFNVQNNKFLRGLFQSPIEEKIEELQLNKDTNKVELKIKGDDENVDIYKTIPTSIQLLFGEDIDDYLKDGSRDIKTREYELNGKKYSLERISDAVYRSLLRGFKQDNNRPIQLANGDRVILEALIQKAQEGLNKSINELGESPISELNVYNAFIDLDIGDMNPNHDKILPKLIKFYKNIDIKIDGKTTGFAEKALLQSNNIISPEFSASAGILRDGKTDIEGDAYGNMAKVLVGEKDEEGNGNKGLLDIPYFKNLTTLKIVGNIYIADRKSFRDFMKKTVQPIMYQASPIKAFSGLFKSVFEDLSSNLFLIKKDGKELSTNSTFATYLNGKNSVSKQELYDLIKDENFIIKFENKDKIQKYQNPLEIMIDKIFANRKNDVFEINRDLINKNPNMLSIALNNEMKKIIDNDINTFVFNANQSLNHFHNLGKLQEFSSNVKNEISDIKNKLYALYKPLGIEFLGENQKIEDIEISQFNPVYRLAYEGQLRTKNGVKQNLNKEDLKDIKYKAVKEKQYNDIKALYDQLLNLNNVYRNSLKTSNNLKRLISGIYDEFNKNNISNKSSLEISNFLSQYIKKGGLIIGKGKNRKHLTYENIIDIFNKSEALQKYKEINKNYEDFSLNHLDSNRIRDFLEKPLVNARFVSSVLKDSVLNAIKTILESEFDKSDLSNQSVRDIFNKVLGKVKINIGNNRYLPINEHPKWSEVQSSVQALLKDINLNTNEFSTRSNIVSWTNKSGKIFTNSGYFSYIDKFVQSVAPLIEHTFESEVMAKSIANSSFPISQMYDAGYVNILGLDKFVNDWNTNLNMLQSYNLALIPYNLLSNYYLDDNVTTKIEGEKSLFKNVKRSTIENLAINGDLNSISFQEQNTDLIEAIKSFNKISYNDIKQLYNASTQFQVISDNTNIALDIDPSLISTISNANYIMSEAKTPDIRQLLGVNKHNTNVIYNLLSIIPYDNNGQLFANNYDVSQANIKKDNLTNRDKDIIDYFQNNEELSSLAKKHEYLTTYENTQSLSPDTYNQLINESVFEENINENVEEDEEVVEGFGLEKDINQDLDNNIENQTNNDQVNTNETSNDEINNTKTDDNIQEVVEENTENKDINKEVFSQYEDTNQILLDINNAKPLDTNSIMNNINRDLDKISDETHKNAIMSFLPDALNNISAFSYIINNNLNEKGGSFIADNETHRGYISINQNVDDMTLLHEVIHAISYWGENANTNEVITINQKISNIKNKIFYHLRKNPKDMYRIGIENQQRLEYIFNTKSNNGLNNQEFLAYFLSNPKAFNYINNLSIRYERNFARKIINFFSNLVQALIKGDLNAIRSGLYGDRLIRLVRDLNRYSDPNNLPKNRFKFIGEYHDKVDKALSNMLKSAFNRDKDLSTQQKNEMYETFLNNFRINRLNGLFNPMIFTSGVYRKALYSYIGEIMLIIDHPITNQIVKLGMDFNALIDGNNTLKSLKDKVNKITSRRVALEADKQREAESSKNAYMQLFKDYEFTEEVDKAIGRIAMNVGISDIVRNNIIQKDKEVINKVIDNDLTLIKNIFENIDNKEEVVRIINGSVKNKLAKMRQNHGYSDKLANYIENAILELGSFRAYGGSTYSGYTNARQLYNDIFNPETIQQLGIKYHSKMITGTANFITNVNQISALDALQKMITDEDTYENFKILNKFISNNEDKRNAILTAMLMLGNQNNRIKNIAKENNSKANDRFLYNNYLDGYLPNINNNEVDVQVVNTNEEAKELYDLGYRILDIKGGVAKEIKTLEDIKTSKYANNTKNNESKYFVMRRVSSISLNDRFIKGSKYQGYVPKGILFHTNNDLPYDEFVKYDESKRQERLNHRRDMAKYEYKNMVSKRVTTSQYEAILGTNKYRLLPSKKMNESIFMNNVKGSEIAYELTASYYDKKQRHELTDKFYTLLIKDAKTYHNRHNKGSTVNHYVNILNSDGTIPNNKVNAFLSAEDRYYLTKMMKENGLKELYINKYLIPEMFGYNDKNLNNHVSNKLPLLKKSLAVIQKGLSLFLKEYKSNVIIRTPEVVTTNLVSNYTTLYLKGLSLKEIESYTYQAYSELNMILDNAKEIASLNAKLDKIKSIPDILTESQINERIKLSRTIHTLQDQITKSPVYPLFEGGLYTNIVEDDINDAGNIDYQFIDRVSKFMSTNKDKEQMLSNILHNGLFTSKSVLYDIGTTITRFADFGGRYALYKHLVDKGESKSSAIKEAREVFIDYNAPTYSGILNFMNKYGLSAFSRYWSGIQKTIANVSIENPLRALEIAFLQFYLMPNETISILGDNILNRNLPLLLGNPDISKIGNNMFRWNGVLSYI